jgi:ABC-type branched-subunit amino acid transport system permease subunit
MINPYWELVILLALINVIFALSLNLVLGFNGQFALGHAGFLLVGAYASGVATTVLQWPLWAGILLSMTLTVIAALLVGYPVLRLRGDYLAIATLGFGEIIRIVTLTLPPGTFGGPLGMRNVVKVSDYLPIPEPMNGMGNLLFTALFALVALGLTVWAVWAFAGMAAAKLRRWIPPRWTRLGTVALVLVLIGVFAGRIGPVLFGGPRQPGIFQFHETLTEKAFGSQQWALFALFILLVGSVWWLIRNYLASANGRAVIAIREDEIAASNLGINIFWVKLRNFMFSGALAGLAGALTAHTLPLFRPADFDFFRSVDVLLMVVLGGMGSMTGSVIGAIIITLLPEALRFLAQWRLVIYSLILILFMLFRPGGLMGRHEIGQLIRFKFLHPRQSNPEGGAGDPEQRHA